MRKIVLMLCLALLTLCAQAQERDFYRQGTQVAKAGGEQLDKFKTELAQLAKSNKESDVLNAVYGYSGLGDSETAESLYKALQKKFPNGTTARNTAMFALENIKDGAAMEKAYKNWLKRFPLKKFGNDGVAGQAIFLLANAYAKEGNVEKVMEYTKKCSSPLWRSMICSAIADPLVKAGKSDVAGKLLKESCEMADKALPTAGNREKRQYGQLYAAYADWLADNGQPDEAWKLFTTKVDDRERSLNYWKLALDHGMTMQTWTNLDGLLRDGEAGKDYKELMKQTWTKVNGNADGFDDYVKGVNKNRTDEMLAKIPEKMIDKPAPDFTLKDIDGNTVQLSKLRGKVVVLDFWATWCGPCKRSLPAMKMTVDKYKNDPDVVFLFIHTWERGTAEQANKDAKAYLHDNGFDEFHLVMDTRNPETKKNEAVSAFGVTGIPAKFVIDKQGHIRFQLTGFGGSNEDAVAELSKMIELARKNS